MKTFITGHKSPDTDSVASALVMADLEKYLGNDTGVACRLGEISKETAYALNYFKVEAPKYVESINEGTPVILVDHNEFIQSVNGIEKAKISKVIDHHRICGFQTADPLFYMAQPVGCTSTILFEVYKMNNIEITPTIAGLMLSAIISDTLLLKSPTTTIKDIKAVEELAQIANVDYKVYGLDMLKAGTDLSDYSAEELLNIYAYYVENTAITFEYDVPSFEEFAKDVSSYIASGDLSEAKELYTQIRLKPKNPKDLLNSLTETGIDYYYQYQLNMNTDIYPY